MMETVYEPFDITDVEFSKISRLVYEYSGIYLSRAKKELVKARLSKRLREGQFKSFNEYYKYVLNDDSGRELVFLLDSIATNFTFFFREPKHFEYLRESFLPDLIKQKRNQERKLRFWSAGCSSGEEAYSIAMVILEVIDNPLVWNIHVFATDLSTRMLRFAKSGIYHREKISNLPSTILKKYFLKGEGKWKNYVKVKDHVKQYVKFNRLNLAEPFSLEEGFDCIFCRNVMIYFDKIVQKKIIERFYEVLNPGGLFIIGHAESLSGIDHSFRYVRPSIYKKDICSINRSSGVFLKIL